MTAGPTAIMRAPDTVETRLKLQVQRVLKAELAHIVHAHGIEDAIEVIAFVLHHTGMEAIGLPFNDVPIFINNTLYFYIR